MKRGQRIGVGGELGTLLESHPTRLSFALRRHLFRPIERVMGQQHRVRVKRRRRVAYLDRKKVAAKAAPIRREAPKAKAKPKKQAAVTLET